MLQMSYQGLFSYDRDGLVLLKHLQSYDFAFSLHFLLLPFFDFFHHHLE